MVNISNNKEKPGSPGSHWPDWVFCTLPPGSQPGSPDPDPADYQPVAEPPHDDDRREDFLDDDGPVSEDDCDFYFDNIDPADYAYLTGPRNYPPPCFTCGGRLIHSKVCAELQLADAPLVPFGKHKGKRLDEVPFTYLAWLSRESDCNSELKTAAKAEISRRKAG